MRTSNRPRRGAGVAALAVIPVIALGSLATIAAPAQGQTAVQGSGTLRPVSNPQQARATPDEVIDAGTNADQAAAAITAGCTDPATGKLDRTKCQWNDDTAITTAYGPARVVGDVLYNCSADRGDGTPTAEVAIGVSDERAEQTSLSESISLTMSLGFLDLEKTSVGFTAFTGQSSRFATTVKATDVVSVPPGYKGYVQTEVLSAAVNGSVYITQGINLIQVKNIDMKFPGYESDSTPSSMAQVAYSGIKKPMTPTELSKYCPTTVGAEPGVDPTQDEHFKLAVCQPAPPHSRHRGKCVRRPVSSSARLPRLSGVTATLSRDGQVYASEGDRTGGMKLSLQRTITPGDYMLTMHEKPTSTTGRDHGKVVRKEQHDQTITIPLKIAWTMTAA